MKKTSSTEITNYAQMGMAALLPGMQHMLTLMQQSLDEMRAALLMGQGGKRRGWPRGPASGRRGWPEDPEERSAEMRRRMAMRNQEAKAANHPRHPDHPDHEKFIAKLKKARSKVWASMTPEQQKAHLAKMQKGKKRAKKQQALAPIAVAS